MEAILKFDFDHDGDKDLYEIYNKAFDYYNAILEIEEKLRRLIKYGTLPDEQRVAIEQFRNTFYDILQKNKIDTA